MCGIIVVAKFFIVMSLNIWICNIVFPEASALLSGRKGQLTGSGGWILGAAQALVSLPDIKLAVAAVSPSVDTLTSLEGEKIKYYLLPYGKGNQSVNHEYEPLWKQIKEEFLPDVVHIHAVKIETAVARTAGAEAIRKPHP